MYFFEEHVVPVNVTRPSGSRLLRTDIYALSQEGKCHESDL
jgi:hypothetical protein